MGTPGPRNVLLVEQAEKGRECSQVGRGHPSFSGQWGRGTPGVGRRPAPGTSDWQVLLSSRVMFGKLFKSAVPGIARLRGGDSLDVRSSWMNTHRTYTPRPAHGLCMQDFKTNGHTQMALRRLPVGEVRFSSLPLYCDCSSGNQGGS